jgi:S-adenosylmethionine:tRNA ribosyltransferase-isomerase
MAIPDLYKTESYDYFLPEELIAQSPIEPRDASRLMVLHRDEGTIEHRRFRDIVEYLSPGDLLVANDTRVIPARLRGKKGSGGEVEIFLLAPLDEESKKWKALVRPGRRLRAGQLIFLDCGIRVVVESDLPEGIRVVSFPDEIDVRALLEEFGEVPLPPYIRKKDLPFERYQTVFAKNDGSVAAPTAGLHFTEALMASLSQKGVILAWITLHVGLGTFRPVKVTDIKEHTMHSERYVVPSQVAEQIAKTKSKGRRVVAVGTTVVRCLESAALENGSVKYGPGIASLFIYPGFQFRVVDALITNFHLPKSTLLMLVAAFAGYENIIKAYQIAIKEQYRFFSFGDAMLIL